MKAKALTTVTGAKAYRIDIDQTELDLILENLERKSTLEGLHNEAFMLYTMLKEVKEAQ